MSEKARTTLPLSLLLTTAFVAFAAFVADTGYRTVAERPLDPADFPGAPPAVVISDVSVDEAAGTATFTVTRSNEGSIASSPVTNSHAKRMASRLK